MKKKKVKLSLNAQKVSSLNPDSKHGIKGGTGYPSAGGGCGGTGGGPGATDTCNTCFSCFNCPTAGCPTENDCPTNNNCPLSFDVFTGCEGNTYPTNCFDQ